MGHQLPAEHHFSKDKMGERIFPQGINIVDDPLRKRGLKSRPFDGEGVDNPPFESD